VTGWPFPFALLAGALLGAVAAVAIGLPALRLRGLHLAISTLAFATGVDAILLNSRYLGKHLPDAVRRPIVLGIDFADQRVFYYFTLAFLLVAVGAVAGMRRSRTGRALIACRDNDSLAQAFGINLVRLRLSSFAISGFIAALAGGLFAYAQFGVHSQTFDVGASINIFLVAVIGGMGTIAGPLMGAAYYGIVNIFSDSPLIALIATGGGVILVLLFLPGGLADGAFRIRDALLRRVAERRHISVPSLIADGKGAVGELAPIAPKQRPGGGKILVPSRYRLDDQWGLEARRRMARSG
jgi:branched-chain amino acid transport system permease protein